jgi:hypothetical protein
VDALVRIDLFFVPAHAAAEIGHSPVGLAARDFDVQHVVAVVGRRLEVGLARRLCDDGWQSQLLRLFRHLRLHLLRAGCAGEGEQQYADCDQSRHRNVLNQY